MGEEVIKRRRGRPLGSKNKNPFPVTSDPKKGEPLIKDGFPNLPVVQLIGRPMGAKDQFPRQSGHSTEENEAYLDFMRSR